MERIRPTQCETRRQRLEWGFRLTDTPSELDEIAIASIPPLNKARLIFGPPYKYASGQ